MPRKDLADELRELRKTVGQKSVSKMKMFEIAGEIERLKHHTATTASSAINGGTVKVNKKMVSKVADVKEAKEAEFPVAPEKSSTKTATKTSTKATGNITVTGGAGSGDTTLTVAKGAMAKKVATVKKTVEKPKVKKAKKVVEVVSESDEE